MVDQDECWFSRFAQPDLYAWAVQGDALRLGERTPTHKDTQKALACYGARRQDSGKVILYVCEDQPQSEYTWLMLSRLLDIARQEDKRVLAVIWDHASWHKSKRLRQWIHTYNQHAKRTRDVRLLTLLLPKQSPWLNPIEPCWVHAKKKVCEPDGDLTVLELTRRLCSHFQADPDSVVLKLSDFDVH